MNPSRNHASTALRLGIAKERLTEKSGLQHTLGHVECPACMESKNMFVRTISASMRFDEASECFLDLLTVPSICGSARFVRERTLDDYRQYARRLGIFFGSLRLEQIHVGHLAQYQQRRLRGEGFPAVKGKETLIASPAGPKKVNQELGLLKRILETAGCWHGELALHYRRFQQVESDIDPALSYDEQQYMLSTMASRPEWSVLYWYSLVALHTCFSSDELRTIRQGDINLTHGILGVNRKHGKNSYRRREVQLTDGACTWALGKLIERVKQLGCAGPHLYLFPYREARNRFDGTRAMSVSGLYRPFGDARAQAGAEWFRLNGWRHTGITRLAESAVPIAVIQARAGHSSPKMTAHYTHISEAAQRMDMERAAVRRPVHSVIVVGAPRKPVQSAAAIPWTVPAASA